MSAPESPEGIIDKGLLASTVDVFSRPLFHLPGVVRVTSETTGMTVTVRRAPFTLAQAEEMRALRQEGAPAFVVAHSGVIRRLSSMEQEYITSV